MKHNFAVNTWGNDLISVTNTRTNVCAKTHVVITESGILRNRDAMYRIRYFISESDYRFQYQRSL